MKNYAIAIDGPSGAGKSTLARGLAKELNFVYVDTGAIYRTVGYRAWQLGISPTDQEPVAALLPQLDISISYSADGMQLMYLNGENVTEAIRLPEVSMYTSHLAVMPEVRTFLMDMQRDMAGKNSVVMDGRDIGTVVLPDADVKIFLTASAEERAKRRFRELKQRGTPLDYGVLLVEIEERDYIDSHRATAPLKAAEGAVTLDTTGLTFEESLERLLAIVKEKTGL
ncbi:MAG: (d)CMP kinase [Oscillospiraceae bacterium]|nr:(d)CMP kinase [Oscillospiraceae bacterium]